MSRSHKPNIYKKRIVALSDGTWQTPENVTPTNILRLTMAIDQEDPEGIQQIVYYDSGLGTQGAVDKVMGGGLGEGIDVNIRELYSFLVLNYDEGDDVYLFGFSRGSYTVRSLAGMIYKSGLVRRDQLQFVKEAYDLYRDNEGVDSERATSFREAHGDRIPIKLLACFDTVGSLGLPFKGPLSFFTPFNAKRYRFHSTTLNPLIENAIHMLSIDEERAIFSPTLMTAHEEVGEDQLTQLYFWGSHGGVGGGDNRELPSSDNTLRFCVDEMNRRGLGLSFDMEKIPDYVDAEFEMEDLKPDLLLFITEKFTGKFVRRIESVEMLHPIAIKRYQRTQWRPAALHHLEEDILNAEITE